MVSRISTRPILLNEVTGLAQDPWCFAVHGCNFDAIAPEREQNHNLLWKQRLYAVGRPVCRCGVIWAIRQLGDGCVGNLRKTHGVFLLGEESKLELAFHSCS